jgi:hypothetical protein
MPLNHAWKAIRVTFDDGYTEDVYLCQPDWETLQQRYKACGRWGECITIDNKKATDCQEIAIPKNGAYCSACNQKVQIT